MKTFIVDRKDVKSGQFPMKSLKAYSLYQNVKIIVRDKTIIHTVIENGKVKKMEKNNGKSSACIQR